MNNRTDWPVFAVPAIFLVLFAAVFGQALSVLAPPFFKYALESVGPGQAIREAVKWSLIEILVPLAGGITGAVVAALLRGRTLSRREIDEDSNRPV